MTAASNHVVLGGNGVVGRETLRALLRRGEQPASVGRGPSGIGGVASVVADLSVQADASRALAGATVAYFTVGLAYSSAVWAEKWPLILRNTIDAAIANGTHLVYFDNVYAYGVVDGAMTERTSIAATTRKGRVRADALAALDTAAAERGLSFAVARSADFYGPGAATSVFNGFALARIAAGRTGTWLFDADQPHSLTYTPDIGEALAILGAHPTPGVWHVPTAPALTGREYVRLAAADSRVNVMGLTTMRLGALFSTAARETLELSYQYTAPYLFDSQAFESAFGLAPTPVADGIAAALEAERAA